VRVLLVTYAELDPRYGAAQPALNLAAALRDRGHDAEAWAPPPPPPELRWWHSVAWRRGQLQALLAGRPRYDVVDLPPLAVAGGRLPASILVARSTQPDLRYWALEARGLLRAALRSPARAAAHLGHRALLARRVVAGFQRADVIFCLGSLEMRWMRRRLPWTRRKLRVYVNAPAPAEQEALARVRAGRDRSPRPAARFLWIGRWSDHKGPRTLVEWLRRRHADRPCDRFTLAGCGDQAAADIPPAMRSSGVVAVVPSFTRGELANLLAGHDAGVFTSRVEGWGQTLNEMLESGLPVYATAAGGVADLKPFFPGTLREFPPSDGSIPGAPASEPSGDYYEVFNWDRIASRYERDVQRSDS
jgi:glycosyltransferase involved in cell wall biosynthesis